MFSRQPLVDADWFNFDFEGWFECGFKTKITLYVNKDAAERKLRPPPQDPQQVL